MIVGKSQFTNHLRPSARPQAPANVAALDTVSLSSGSSPHFEPASHLDRAAQEYFDLVATHPSEQEEFYHGVQEVKKIVSEVLYGGRWPEAEEMPDIPPQKTPGAMAQNGGLTKSEQLVSDDLIAIYRKTAPSVKNQDQHKRLASAIHLCQSGLQSRILRRDYPDYWMSSPGTLAKDAARECERWGC